MEWEEEEGVLDHWSHKHPLSLVEASREGYNDDFQCDGCIRSSGSLRRSDTYISSEERIYRCSKRCGSGIAFHKECAEIPRKIKHPVHPQHVLIQEYFNSNVVCSCALCKREIHERVSYSCTSSECHEFHIHLRCAQAGGVMDADDDDEQVIHHHRSHPEHQLMFLNRRAGGSHSFRCDACGTKRRENSYLCIVCTQFWIHQKCASLPDSITNTYHPHTLSLSFLVPHQYMLFDIKCHICYAKFNPKYWIYHCQLCRFIVHVKCAFKKVHPWYPIFDVVKQQITPFVTTRVSVIPDKIVNVKYEVPYHKHELSLIPSSTSSSSELICDGCITPILFDKEHDDEYMMSCSECKYILHWACSQLPPQLPSLPLHNEPHHHELVLQSCDELEYEAECQVCGLYTNGLLYACTTCDFKADIKCASLPDSIHHRSHLIGGRGHLLSHFSKEEMLSNIQLQRFSCDAGCGILVCDFDCYRCGACDFIVHVRCAVLPPTTTNRIWDKHHPLTLTYCRAVGLHDLYCDRCEEEMGPNDWMYSCDVCDLSFHPRCFPDVSGEYRNIKFGQQYTIATAHPHPLAYQFLTIKRRCDICRRDAYNQRGFQCAPCNFFICFDEWAQQLLLARYPDC